MFLLLRFHFLFTLLVRLLLLLFIKKKFHFCYCLRFSSFIILFLRFFSFLLFYIYIPNWRIILAGALHSLNMKFDGRNCLSKCKFIREIKRLWLKISSHKTIQMYEKRRFHVCLEVNFQFVSERKKRMKRKKLSCPRKTRKKCVCKITTTKVFLSTVIFQIIKSRRRTRCFVVECHCYYCSILPHNYCCCWRRLLG
jgi:hypothetical protein